ncbi:nuclear transport factor 2 family protein [Streptomyces sp. NPDC002889]|uniref:nuclear transport factor 2 family protein n=1 Tax=Streptomyces sp. NPDC002889 TaxID=3364669 RepID=UPI0036C94169
MARGTAPPAEKPGRRPDNPVDPAPWIAVTDALLAYFDGLHHGDIDTLAQVFHPGAVYATATEGHLLRLTLDEYLPVVSRREPPVARREPRRDRIVSIEFAGPVTAMARVECAIGPRHFTDFLTLVLVDGRWQIIAKVFHFETAGVPAAPPMTTAAPRTED